MRNLKRALSLALAALMLIGMMVVSAGAASKDFTDADEIQHKEAVNVMTTLNVVSGKDDGSYFAPNDTFTREEMAKVVSYVMNGGVEPVVGTKVTPTYSDIKGIWSEKYIEYCTSMGIIAGDGSGKFNPTGTLTAEQCAKMFLTAMGYDAKVFGFVGNDWAINVGRYANEAGLYEELGDIVATDPISRDDAMQMAYNAIQATMMKKTWSQNVTTGQMTESYQPWLDSYVDINGVTTMASHTLLLDKFDANMYQGVLAATGDYDLSHIAGIGENDNVANSDGFVVDVDRVNSGAVTKHDQYFEYKDQDLTNLMGQYVKVLANEKTGQVYGVYAVAGKNTVLETAASLTDYTGLTNKVKVDGKTYNLESDIIYVYGENTTWDHDNNPGTARVNCTSAIATDEQRADKVVYIDNDGNGKFDLALVTPVDVAEITFKNDTNITFAPVKGYTSLPVNTNAQLVEDMIIEGELATGDYAILTHNYYSESDMLTKAEVKSGAVTGVRNPIQAGQAPYEDYQIDGAWYRVAVDNGSVANSAIKSGASVNYVAINNVLFYAKLTSGATLDDVAVIYMMNKSNPDNFGNEHLAAKVMFSDGSTKEVAVDALYASSTSTTNEVKISDGLATEKTYVGVPVSYKVNNSGNYEFYRLSNNVNDRAGFDQYLGNVGATRPNSEWTIAGNLVSDNALIVVRNASAGTNSAAGKITYLSGAEYKKITGEAVGGVQKFNTASGAYALIGKDSDGFSRVMFAIVETTAQGWDDSKFTLGVVSGSSYAYLTKDSWTETIDGNNYNCFEIWNGTETLTVKEKATAVSYDVRSVIAFDNVGDGIIKNVSSVGAVSYITAPSSGSSIEIAGTTYKVTNDTVILNVDDDAHTGVSGSATTKAREVGANSGQFIPNAYFMATNGELDFIVVDVAKNQLFGFNENITMSNGGSTIAASDLNAVLSNPEIPSVTLDGDMNITGDAVLVVPQGKTLTIKGDVTMLSNWEVYGTLNVEILTLNGMNLKADGTVNAKDIVMGSTISGKGVINCQGASIKNGTTMTINMTEGGKLNIGGDVTGDKSATLEIKGESVVTISGDVSANVTVSEDAALTVGVVEGNLTASDSANVVAEDVEGALNDNTTDGSVEIGGVPTGAVKTGILNDTRKEGEGKLDKVVGEYKVDVTAGKAVTGVANVYDVALTATDLLKHQNANNAMGYWAGISVKANVGDSYSFGWGAYPTGAQFTKITKETVAGEEEGYITFYFDFGKTKNEGAFYVAIKDANGNVTLYNGDCSKVTLKTTENVLAAAKAYQYTPERPWTNEPVVDGLTVTYTGKAADFVDSSEDGSGISKATGDLARLVGAIYHQDNGASVTAIKYDSKYYTWNAQGTLKGSNWENDGTTLVKAVATALESQSDQLTRGVSFTFEINGDTVTLTLKAEA